MNKLAILVPTKGRPGMLQDLKDSYDRTKSGYSEMIPIIDEDEMELYSLSEKDYPIILHSPAEVYLTPKLNEGALDPQVQAFDYVCLLGDDVIIHTEGFDKIIVDEMNNSNWQVLHCEDMLHHGRVANHWIVRTKLVKEFGFMILPVLVHMFGDNFWTTIGQDTDSIKFLENVVWEHKHYITGKTPTDETYSRASAMMERDEKAYYKFMASEEYQKLILILKEHMK